MDGSIEDAPKKGHVDLYLCLSRRECRRGDRRVCDLTGDGVRRHAAQLFRDHASVARIEIWREDSVIETLGRDGIRPWPAPSVKVSGDLGG